MLYDWLHFIQFTLYPPTCVLCGAAGAEGLDLCPGCRADLPRIGACCRHCARPLPQPGICGACLTRLPPYTRTVAPFHYAGAIRQLVTGLKFHQQLGHARLLGELLAAHLADEPERPDLLLPVPLHGGRLRERGYNQALELARPVARRLEIPLDARSLVRVRATPPQSDLHERERHRNVRGAFALARPLSARHVALVDDVVTTGSTVAEAARVLLRAGVERVEVWCVAHTAARHGGGRRMG